CSRAAARRWVSCCASRDMRSRAFASRSPTPARVRRLKARRRARAVELGLARRWQAIGAGNEAPHRAAPSDKEGAMKALGCAIVAAVSMFSAAAAPARAAQNACEREMVRAASAYGVPLGVLYAVGRTESGRGDSMRPNALNIEGRTVYDLERGAAV